MDHKNLEYKDLLLQYEDLIDIKNSDNDSELVCECFLLSVSDLKEMILCNKEKIENIPQWCFNNTRLGHGCGSCMKNQDYWKNTVKNAVDNENNETLKTKE